MVYGAAGCLIVVNYSTGDMRCQYEIGENEKMEKWKISPFAALGLYKTPVT